jgi:hypothetical protein
VNVMAAVQTEKNFQASVSEYARVTGWLLHHTRPACIRDGWRTPIQGDAGFPDLAMTRRGRLIFAELKSKPGGFSRAQGWLGALSACPGCQVFLWRPSDWSSIEEVLQ